MTELAHGTLVTDPQVAAVESPRPYLHPLTDARGRSITDFRPADHDWHHALSLAVAVVTRESGIVSFWGGPTFVRDAYIDLKNHGRQVVVGGSTTTLDIEWRSRDDVLMTEQRNHRFVDVDADTWALEVTSTWRATELLRFGSPTTEGRENAGYGGFFLRADPRFVGAEVILAGEAVGEERAMGATAAWCALAKPGEGTVAMVAPGPWFVRSEPVAMLCAAPFFRAEFVLGAGETAEWRWWLVSCAMDVDAASLGRIIAALP